MSTFGVEPALPGPGLQLSVAPARLVAAAGRLRQVSGDVRSLADGLGPPLLLAAQAVPGSAVPPAASELARAWAATLSWEADLLAAAADSLASAAASYTHQELATFRAFRATR